jgi:serine/threonine protein kinase
MEDEIFLERYKICRDQQGNAEEAGRAGAAITYKAVDEKSNEPVLLQLVPLAGIDQIRRDEFETRAKKLWELDHVNVARVLDAGIEHDHFVFVTEYLGGETADAWVVARGTMAINAVLRIGIQVVRAIAAAAFHGLTHRAIQPSNLIILHGEAPCGGWPFVKVWNFGVAALGWHGPGHEARELVPAILPQFASPEQVSNQPIDFRSEIYSLGATMCFLLTGAVPLPGSDDGKATRRGRRRLPDLRSIPKPVGSLLGAMLAENPEHRPLDPVGLERHMLTVLDELERRHAFARKVGIPVAAYVQRKIVRSRSPIAQVVRGGLAVAGLLMALAAIGAIVRPNYFHRARSLDKIGVSVGVPATEPANVASPGRSSLPPNIVSTARSTASPSVPPIASAAAPQPSTTPSTSIAQENKRSENADPAALETAGSAAGKGEIRSAPTLAETDATASRDRDRQPEPALERPDHNEASPVSRPEYRGKTQAKATTSTRANSLPMTRAQRRALAMRRWPRAHFLGMTPRGNMLFRLPSGKIVAVMSGDHPPPVARPRSPGPEIYGAPRPYGYPPPDYDY